MVLFCEASSGFPWLSAHALFSLAACRDCEVCIILAGHPERLCGADGDHVQARLSVHAGEFCQSTPEGPIGGHQPAGFAGL